MDITPTTVTRPAAVAAMAAGAVFIGVQLKHPGLTVAGVDTTEWVVRSSLVIGSVSFIAAYVLPSIDATSSHDVRDTLAVAMIALGYSLWRLTGAQRNQLTETFVPAPAATPRVLPVGAE